MKEPQDLIIAIKEPHLSRILSGKKTVELRRNHPRLLRKTEYGRNVWGTTYGKKLWLWHDNAIHGYVEISGIDFSSAGWAWYAMGYAEQACLSVDEAYEYLKDAKHPAAYHLGEVKKFATPIKHELKGGGPWSWRYFNAADFNINEQEL